MHGLRLAICCDAFPSERSGGADFVARFAPALAARACDVYVVTSADGGPVVEAVAQGVTVHRLVDAEQLGIANRVEWAGLLADDNVPQRLADLDLCVLLYRRNRLSRSALVAALTAGVPALLGGRADQVEALVAGRDVALVALDDTVGLAAAIERLVEDGSEREQFAAGALRASEHFARPRITERALAVYAEVLA
jgi:glycosyltransferase involved in cell wall biosynthesis